MLLRQIALLAVGLPASACGYDWRIGEPAEGGGGAVSTSATTGGASAGGGSASGTLPGSGGSGSNCATLLADVVETKQAAKACVQAMPSQCTDSVKDECGCNSFVKYPASPETEAFVAAVAAAGDAGCKASCGGCGGPVVGSCILSGSGGTACYP